LVEPSTSASAARRARLVALGHLAGAVSHDVNNVLTAIAGYADLLAATLPDGDARSYVGEIVRAADRGDRLMSALMRVSREDPRPAEVLDLGEVVASIEDVLVALARPAELALKIHPAPCRVRFDPLRLERVVVVLAGSAFPEAGDAPSLETGLREIDGRPFATLELGALPPFGPSAEAREEGLGLASAAAHVAQAGGRLLRHGDPGAVTAYTVLLPLAGER
jgi:two-component system cell cycle sensor histidine kinase/response regulator CckA